MIFLRLTQSLDYQPHLCGRETAAVVGVANGGKPLHQAGVKLHPAFELAPCRFGQDGVTVHLGEFHTPVFPYPKRFHTLLIGCKDSDIMADKSQYYCL